MKYLNIKKEQRPPIQSSATAIAIGDKLKPKSMTLFYNLLARRFRRLSWTWGITCIVLATAITNSYSQCDATFMACNDYVQVSLDNECKIIVTPDMILENPVSDDAEYDVMVWDGRTPLGDSITDDYVNKTLEVSIRCIASGVSCWGYMSVEDKLQPVIMIDPPLVMLDCTTPEDLLTGNPYAFIDTFTVDNGGCGKIDSIDFMQQDELDMGDCGQDDVIRRITRTFSTTDKAGNVSTAQQVIEIRKGQMSDVSYPRDTVIDCIDLPSNGFDPEVFGMPGDGPCSIFKSTHTDTRFELCGGSYKILRTWYVIDWCDNRDTSVTQVLEALDNTAPTWNMNFMNFEPGSTYAGSQMCEGSITLPLEEYAAASDLCYALQTDDYKVTYRRGDTTATDGFEPQIRTDVTILTSGDAVISGLPLGEHQIIITATDACGNSSSASRTVTIEDNTPPNAICERTTTAVLDFSGISEIKAFSLDDHSFDNCNIDRFEVKRLDGTCDGFESDLDFGPSVFFCCDDIPANPVRVVLRVYDTNDRYSDCVVDVVVQDKRPITLTCRPDISVNCDFNFNNLATRLGTPTVATDACNLEDAVLNIPNFDVNSCGSGQFYATWTVSDFGGVRDSCRQQVTIRNENEPSITLPTNVTIQACKVSQAHPEFIGSEPVIGSQDCEIIAASHIDEIDMNPNNGCIRINRKWTVIDWCTFDATDASTVLATGTQVITLQDNTAPIILDCPSHVDVNDNDQNCVEGVTLLIKASDNCALSSELIYAYEVDLNSDGSVDMTGTSADASDIYPAGDHAITWTVTDLCGNVSQVCSNTFAVISIANCDGGVIGNDPAMIAGTLTDENNVAVAAINLNVTNTTTGALLSATTGDDGKYIVEASQGTSYRVEPVLDGNVTLGVSTIDMLLIQRHILGLASFNSNYKMIAADINNSRSITASDLVILQKLILGVQTEIVGNDSWKFVNSDFVFSQSNPYSYPETYVTGPIAAGTTTANFIGLKVGDVSGNAFPALLQINTDPRSHKTMQYDIGKLSENVYQVDFMLPKDMDITGFQFSIAAEGIELIERKDGQIALTSSNVSTLNDEIKISWSEAYGKQLDEDVLFTFLIKGENIDELDLASGFSAEIYDTDLNISKLDLTKIVDQTPTRSLEILQNTPNPFNEVTQISFLLPEKDNVSLTVFDMTGKVLFEKSGIYNRGINQIEVSRNDIKATGVLYYTIETSLETKGQRMILLQ